MPAVGGVVAFLTLAIVGARFLGIHSLHQLTDWHEWLHLVFLVLAPFWTLLPVFDRQFQRNVNVGVDGVSQETRHTGSRVMRWDAMSAVFLVEQSDRPVEIVLKAGWRTMHFRLNQFIEPADVAASLLKGVATVGLHGRRIRCRRMLYWLLVVASLCLGGAALSATLIWGVVGLDWPLQSAALIFVAFLLAFSLLFGSGLVFSPYALARSELPLIVAMVACVGLAAGWAAADFWFSDHRMSVFLLTAPRIIGGSVGAILSVAISFGTSALVWPRVRPTGSPDSAGQ